MKSADGKTRLGILVDEDQRIRMIELGISPTTVARAAFAAEIKRREARLSLRAIRRIDPRVTEEQHISASNRIQRLRMMSDLLGDSLDS